MIRMTIRIPRDCPFVRASDNLSKNLNVLIKFSTNVRWHSDEDGIADGHNRTTATPTKCR